MAGELAEWRRKPRMSVKDYFRKLAGRRMDEYGRELPDPTPMEPPVGFHKQPSLIDTVREMVRSEHMRRAALAEGKETFDEADDFDVADDPFPSSQFETDDDLEPVASLRQKKDASEKAAKEKAAKPPTGDPAPVAGDPPVDDVV